MRLGGVPEHGAHLRQIISNLVLPPWTEELLDALNSGFHLILFWSPLAEGTFPKEMENR